MFHIRRKVVWPVLGIVLLAAGFFVGRADAQGGAAPGSAADPLASVSYVTQAVQTALSQQVPALVTQAVQSALPGVVTPMVQSTVQTDVQAAIANLPAAGGQVAVVTVAAGQKLVAEQGTELILRGGSAVVSLLPTSAGGFSDLTGGADLGQGASVPMNHLLLAARSDGRAIAPQGSAHALVIVIGQYNLQPAQ